jgi:hypothetical protein
MQHDSSLPCEQREVPAALLDLALAPPVEAVTVRPAIPPPPASPMSPQPIHEASLNALFSLTPHESSQVSLLSGHPAQRFEANLFAPSSSHAAHVDVAIAQGIPRRSAAQGESAGPSHVIPPPPAQMFVKFLDAEPDGVPLPSPLDASGVPSTIHIS